MPVTKMSSSNKVKAWFRTRFKSERSISVDSKAVSETTSLQSNGSIDVGSPDHITPPVEAPSPNIQDKTSPPQGDPPTNKVFDLVAVSNKTDTPILAQDLWKQAATFLDEDDQKLLESINAPGDRETVFADLQKVVLEKKRISQEKAWKITFCGRRIVLRDVIAKMVTWLNSYKEIGDLISQADPVHVGLPWAAIKIVFSVFTLDQEQMGLIFIGLEQVICLITRCSIYQQLYLGHSASGTKAQVQAKTELAKTIAGLYAKMFSFLAYYLRLLDLNAAFRTLKSFSQPGEVSEMLTEIGRYELRVTTGANICASAFIRPTLQRIDENTQNVSMQPKEMISKFDKEMIQLWKQLNEDERCKILQWVSDIPYESDHYIASKGRVSGTGQWLLCHDIYKEWRQSDASTLLWLNGIPGAGKTKLSSMVVDDLLTALQSRPHENTGFAYFYCDRNRADHNEPVAIIRSIVRQLCAPWEDTSIEACVENFYLSRKAKGFASDRLVAEECKQLLFELLTGYRNAYIVVDGLDECDHATRHILMDLLDEIIERFEQSVKIYIASRTDQDLQKRYHEGTHLEVTANDNQADIEKYVLSKMEQSEFCRNKLSSTLRSKVLRTFRNKSQGMFQWATLHIGELLQLERSVDIENFLNELPKGLEAAYDKILDRITGQAGSKKSIAFAAFQAVMTSWRPLHPFELAIAVAQNPNHGFILDQDVDIGYVLEACQNLLVVTDGSQERGVPVVGLTPLDGYILQEVNDSVPSAVWHNALGVTKESICKFAHLSIQEYLETKHWRSTEAHVFMAGICLRTLLSLQIAEDASTKDRIKDGCHKKDSGDVAIFYVSEGQKNGRMKVIPVAWVDPETGICESPGPSTKDIEHVKGNFLGGIPDQGVALLPPPLIRVEDEGGPIIELPTRETPTFECYVEVVCPQGYCDDQTSISPKFKPFLEGQEGSPLETWALYCARGLSSHIAAQGVAGQSKSTSESTLRELLTKFFGTSSESTPSYKAWVRLAQNLWDLDERVEVDGYSTFLKIDASGSSSRSGLRTLIHPDTKPALGCAILGIPGMLESWLSREELDPDECNGRGDSLLDIAARAEHTEICKILLNYGANPNFPSSSVLTPLGLAVHRQNLDLGRVLAENGADLNTALTPNGKRFRDGTYSGDRSLDSPIVEAVKSGNFKMVEILLDAAKSSSCHLLQLGEALVRATQSARADLAALVLSHWADDQCVEVQAHIHRALGEIPKTQSGIEVMKVLMRRMKERTHNSLLHEALTKEDWIFAEALITMGVDVNTTRAGHYGETPLHSIFRERCGDTLGKSQKLLHSGAKVNSRDLYGNTPLALGMMRSLFDPVIGTDETCGQADRASREKYSSQERRLEAIRELLDHGADPNAINKDGMSVLGIACVYAKVTPQVIQLLLDHGAAVNMAQGHSSMTMSPLDTLYLHDRPWSTQPRPGDDQLEVVKTMITSCGGKHHCIDNYDDWDSKKRSAWIRKTRIGSFDGPEIMSCFSGVDLVARVIVRDDRIPSDTEEVIIGPRGEIEIE